MAMDRRLMNSTYLQAKVRELHALHKTTIEDYGSLVQSLTTECDILCEIIPNYKIQPAGKPGASGDEAAVRKQKEVFTIEKLEQEILVQYQHFLQLLRKFQQKTHPEQQALGSRMCARLLPVAHEFNNNEVLLTLTVDFANAKATRVAQPCLKALAELLDGEMVTDASHHVVSAILGIVRKEKHALNPKLLQTLLAVRFAMIDVHRPDIADQKAKNKRMKKQDKELARQMMKGQARRDRSELAAKQTKMVHLIFVVYLRVLQASQSCSRVHQTKILAPCLEGLAKFAPLVNVEHYHLLMKALRELLDDEDTSVTTKLHALVAVSCLAQKDAMLDAAEWKTDLTHFHNELFKAMPECLSPPQPEKLLEAEARDKAEAEAEADGGKDDNASVVSTATVGSLGSQAFSIAASMAHHKFVKEFAAREWSYRVSVLLRAVDLLLLVPKHLPPQRILCFVRRMLQYAPLCPPHITLSLLAVCHRLVLRYPSCASVLIGGADYALVGRGVYNADAPDLASCFPEASFAWELSALRNSYHPSVRQVATMMASHYHKTSKVKHGGAPVVTPQLARLGPYELLTKFDACLGDVQPPPPKPKALRGVQPLDEDLKQAQLELARQGDAVTGPTARALSKLSSSNRAAAVDSDDDDAGLSTAMQSGGRVAAAHDDDDDVDANDDGGYHMRIDPKTSSGSTKKQNAGMRNSFAKRQKPGAHGSGKKKPAGRR